MGRLTNNIFLFDIDGVLTDSTNSKISNEILIKLGKLKQNGALVFAVSGSGPDKLIQQGVSPVSFSGYFACLGNYFVDFYTESKPLVKPLMELPKKMMSQFWDIIAVVPFMGYGGYFEERCGMVNVSLIGRQAPEKARQIYNAQENHRDYICQLMSEAWPAYQFLKGGLSSIDVTFKGDGKEQVVDILTRRILNKPANINLGYPTVWHFFGDRFDKFGNDRKLADVLDDYYNRGGLAQTYKFETGASNRNEKINAYLDRLTSYFG